MCVRILIRELSMSASRLSLRELSFTSSPFRHVMRELSTLRAYPMSARHKNAPYTVVLRLKSRPL